MVGGRFCPAHSCQRRTLASGTKPHYAQSRPLGLPSAFIATIIFAGKIIFIDFRWKKRARNSPAPSQNLSAFLVNLHKPPGRPAGRLTPAVFRFTTNITCSTAAIAGERFLFSRRWTEGLFARY